MRARKRTKREDRDDGCRRVADAILGAVLKRDATKSDYIVLPLVAGVLACCTLGVDASRLGLEKYREVWPSYQAEARRLLAECSEENDAGWETSPAFYRTLVVSLPSPGIRCSSGFPTPGRWR